MKNFITEQDFADLEELLMRAQIPYNISWDAHVNDTDSEVTYDKYIRIEPVVVQYARSR